MKLFLVLLLPLCTLAMEESGAQSLDPIELPTCDGDRASEIGYAFESIMGIPFDELQDSVRLIQFCLENDSCKLMDVALDKHKVCTDVTEEPRGRLLAGRPDKHGWGNSKTHRCALEGGFCSCTGNVVYTKKCTGTFKCNPADWETVVARGWNSNHKANVNGGVPCTNNAMGGDPYWGHDKQCFCHPKSGSISRSAYLAKWTPSKCYQQCGNPWPQWFGKDYVKGLMCGARCSGGCAAKAIDFVEGRSPTHDPENCPEYCYCVARGWTA